MDISVASVVSSAILGTAGIVVSIVYGYVPAKRRHKVEQLNLELLKMYKNAKVLLQIEEELSEQLKVSKKNVRKGHQLTKDIEPKRLENRIRELETITRMH